MYQIPVKTSVPTVPALHDPPSSLLPACIPSPTVSGLLNARVIPHVRLPLTRRYQMVTSLNARLVPSPDLRRVHKDCLVWVRDGGQGVLEKPRVDIVLCTPCL